MTAPGTGGPAEDAQMRPKHGDLAWFENCVEGGEPYRVTVVYRHNLGWLNVAGTLTPMAPGYIAARTLHTFWRDGHPLSAAAGSVPEDGGEALRRRDGCMRADKACRWRPATTSDANPEDLVCDGCGARQRPVSEVERIEDLRDEFPQNGPLGKPGVRTDERDLRTAAAPAGSEDGGEALRREVERLCDESLPHDGRMDTWVKVSDLRAALSAVGEVR